MLTLTDNPVKRHVDFIPILVVFVMILAWGCSGGGSDDAWVEPEMSDTTWEAVESPESVGWSTQGLRAARESAEITQTAAVMIIYQGKVLYHWGDIEYKYMVHSIRKSFVNALYGIYVEEGLIDMSDTMADLGIDDIPPSLSDKEKTATVNMLIQARSGIYHEAAAESPEMKAARPVRHGHDPGTFWYYNNWDFNVLGTILEQETGTGIFEAFKTRIADPIGMEDFTLSDCDYACEPVSMHPAYPFRMSARDMARFGLLFLNNGMWEGKRILSADWIEQSTTAWSLADDALGYGYMWWVVTDAEYLGIPNLDGAYFASGYHGHYIAVIPELDLVIVHRVDTDAGDNVTNEEFVRLVNDILQAKQEQT